MRYTALGAQRTPRASDPPPRAVAGAYTQLRGVLQASSKSASGLPAAGFWSYSQRAVSGSDIRMLSMRPPVFSPKVVPRS